ncbi:MAG: GGDEF domain-containing protein [Clostridium sp.]
MDILSTITQKLCSFGGLYDAIRILNINTFNTIAASDDRFLNFHCLNNKSCPDCLALKALQTNKTFRKLLYHEDKAFLMTISPVEINNQIFIVELFSNVTNTLLLENASENESVCDFFFSLNTKINIDPLTKAYNRNFLFSKPKNKFINKSTDNVSLIMLDLDHFKLINDTYGHLLGDTVLKALASRIMKLLKSKDILCRYGGEEFLIILDSEDKEHAIKFATIIKENLNTIPFILGSEKIFITCSMGLSSSIYKNSSLEELLNIADTNLYAAKKSGRNALIF